MKKNLTTFLMAAMLAISIPAVATIAFAQTRYCDSSGREYQNENRQYSNRDYQYENGQYADYGQPNAYQRHRKAMNIGIATGAGAIIGALLGGRKGALIGAAAGVATGVVVTKKQNSRTYYRRY